MGLYVIISFHSLICQSIFTLRPPKEPISRPCTLCMCECEMRQLSNVHKSISIGVRQRSTPCGLAALPSHRRPCNGQGLPVHGKNTPAAATLQCRILPSKWEYSGNLCGRTRFSAEFNCLVPNLSGRTWFSAKIGFSAGSRSDLGGGLAGTRDRAPDLAPAQPPLVCPLAPTGGDALNKFQIFWCLTKISLSESMLTVPCCSF